MIRLRGLAAIYGEVWYDEEPPCDCGVDIVLYRHRRTPLVAQHCVPFLSLVTDLTPAPDALMQGFAKECRYEIRRAAGKDALSVQHIADPSRRIGEFARFYDAFAQQKSLPSCHRAWLEAACQARQLALSAVARDGAILVWHAYALCGRTARLEYSASLYRTRASDERAFFGRANRWLHWQDMLRFRQAGLVRYDWGGVFEDASAPERAGINHFKRGFGGRPERSYNCSVPVTLRGRVYLPVRTAWRRWRFGARAPNGSEPSLMNAD